MSDNIYHDHTEFTKAAIEDTKDSFNKRIELIYDNVEKVVQSKITPVEEEINEQKKKVDSQGKMIQNLQYENKKTSQSIKKEVASAIERANVGKRIDKLESELDTQQNILCGEIKNTTNDVSKLRLGIDRLEEEQKRIETKIEIAVEKISKKTQQNIDLYTKSSDEQIAIQKNSIDALANEIDQLQSEARILAENHNRNKVEIERLSQELHEKIRTLDDRFTELKNEFRLDIEQLDNRLDKRIDHVTESMVEYESRVTDRLDKNWNRLIGKVDVHDNGFQVRCGNYETDQKSLRMQITKLENEVDQLKSTGYSALKDELYAQIHYEFSEQFAEITNRHEENADLVKRQKKEAREKSDAELGVKIEKIVLDTLGSMKTDFEELKIENKKLNSEIEKLKLENATKETSNKTKFENLDRGIQGMAPKIQEVSIKVDRYEKEVINKVTNKLYEHEQNYTHGIQETVNSLTNKTSSLGTDLQDLRRSVNNRWPILLQRPTIQRRASGNGVSTTITTDGKTQTNFSGPSTSTQYPDSDENATE